MKLSYYILLGLLGTVVFQGSYGCSDAPVQKGEDSIRRIVSLSGAITETLDFMGFGDQIVGVDVTSTYPAELVSNAAQLGHVSMLNPEALLALDPDIIFISAKDTVQKAIGVLRNTGARMVMIPEQNDLKNALVIADILDEYLGDPHIRIVEMKSQIETNLKRLASIRQENDSSPTVLFVYARGTGSMMVAGEETSADYMIRQSGGLNAVSGFTGFKALTPEALITAQPDLLLFFESGLESLGGREGLLEVVGISQTPAGKNESIIAMDGLYLLGFTPRAPEAAVELAMNLKQVGSPKL